MDDDNEKELSQNSKYFKQKKKKDYVIRVFSKFPKFNLLNII